MFQPLTAQIDAILRDAFVALNLPSEHAHAVVSGRPELADLQCNGAMPAAKAVGGNPGAIASAIKDMIRQRPEFSEVSVAGPGFLNMRLSPALLGRTAAEMGLDENLGIADEGRGRVAIIDFGGPNVAKPLHVGHLRSLVIGESLRRIHKALGWKVVADAHLGDWGLQLGMLISEIRRRAPSSPWFAPGFEGPWPTAAPVTVDELELLYPEAAAACTADPARMAEARADTAALQAGDLGLTALWRSLRTLSLEAQKSDFVSLNVRFDLLNGESDAQPLIGPLVDDLKRRGLAIESDGATVFPIAEANDRKEMPPLLLAKGDGAALYATTDLATLADRVARMGAERILYVVDQRQALHFEQVFRAARKAGLSGAAELRHVGFGTVNGPDGKPYKTRQGGVARLSDLLDEAVAKAALRLAESGYGIGLDEAAKTELARKVGIAAVKFADLGGERLSGYVFDPERFVTFEGRTGPYLQYACVRIRSIVAKADERRECAGMPAPASRPEMDLLLACLGFPAAVSDAARRLEPSVLAEYAFTLARSFSHFYPECPVLTAPSAAERASRLAMCRLTGLVLERSLDLLGIDVPERM
ncbi:MAG: arginine--tRNA ligase [Nitrobacter sp.]|uniref:arginine--tRNA ligase n=1 Tax=Nitrobacter sp. TaxID=29420 RepID=UPI00387DDDB8